MAVSDPGGRIQLDRHGGKALSVPVTVAVVIALIIAVATVTMLFRRPPRLAIPAPDVTMGGADALIPALLSVVVLALVGIFVLLLVLVLCVCGCGPGRDGKGVLQLLATLVPGVAAGLRLGGRGFTLAADAALASVEPLDAVGKAFRDSLGPALAGIGVPSASLPHRHLWDALQGMGVPGIVGPRPARFDGLYVITGVDLTVTYPFGPLGTRLTADGARLVAASDEAERLEPELRAAGRGLNQAASAIDGQP